MTKCLECKKDFPHRKGKKFCSHYCKSLYHYKNNKIKGPSLYETIDSKIKQNRKILKKFSFAGRTMVNKSMIMDEGFDPAYYTHNLKTNKGNTYLFCYEYGYREIKENDTDKLLIVHWEDYMPK